MTVALDPSPLLPLAIVPRRHVDNRGWLSEFFHCQRLRDLGMVCTFVQDNQSRSDRRGSLRGLHFQLPPAAQAKLVSVACGSILDVVVDIRRGSPTYGNWVSVELSSRNGKQIFVPIGFAHGFVTLEDDVSVLYKVSEYFAPFHESGIRWNDQDVGFRWPFQGADIIRSEKDERLPFLKDIESPFSYDGNPLSKLPTIDLG